jgi:hypothetical protein
MDDELLEELLVLVLEELEELRDELEDELLAIEPIVIWTICCARVLLCCLAVKVSV